MKTEFPVYPKIPGLHAFDPNTRTYTTEYSTPEIAALAEATWRFTEKVDGTSMRICWDGYKVTWAGRTDRSETPAPLANVMQDYTAGPLIETLFEQKFGNTPVFLYGEGFGGKIQKGGRYRETEDFVLFDAMINGVWLLPETLRDIGRYLGLSLVPEVWQGSLQEAELLVSRGLPSAWDDSRPAEGLVGVPVAGFLDRRGNRVAVKIKARDLR